MTLEVLPMPFTVCQLSDVHSAPLGEAFCFLSCTDEEISLVCPTASVPEKTLRREDGWRAMRIAGVLDFSLVGILAKISGLLADAQIPVFCCSTYNTDYILVRENTFSRASEILRAGGYEVL